MTEQSGGRGRDGGLGPVFFALVVVVAVGLGSLVLVGAVAGETGEAPDCGAVSYSENDDGQFEVENLSQLQCIEDIEDGPGLDQDYVLVDDIDASETEDWNDGEGFEPIGECGFEMFAADPEFICEEDSFTGTFDGDGKTISDLTIDRPDEADVGLFGGVTGGTIENVTLENATIVGNDVVGALAGGFETALVSETHMSGTVDATASFAYVGGLVGMGGDSEIHNSSTNTTVNTDGTFAGGLAGMINSTTVRESFATGDVNGEDAEAVGGLLGSMFVGNNVTESYATGDVTGYDGAGGLVSDIGSVAESGGILSNSYATGNVSGEDDIGGLVGIIFGGGGEISTAYATGTVSGDTNVGGLVGDIDHGSVSDSYWDYEQSPDLDPDDGIGDGSGDVTGLATAEMTGLNATEYMDSLAFPASWLVVEDDYPVLAWQDTDPFYAVNITETNSPVSEGSTLDVTTEVTNWGTDGEQTVTLTDTDFSDEERDSREVELDSGEDEELDLEWETDTSDDGTGDVMVASENDTATEEATIRTNVDSVTATIDGEADPTVTAGKSVDVTVTVEDENSDPVEGEEVSVDDLDTGDDDVTVDGLSVDETETTGSDGNATFEDVTFSGAIDATVAVTVSAVDETEDVLTVTVGGFAAGDGSADNPYEIADWHHLDDLRFNLDANVTLGTDLNESTAGYGSDGEDGVVLNASGELRDGAGFDPIGECDFVSASDTDDDLMEICDGDGFSGTFDGNGHTISNLSIDRADEDDVGLFGGVTGGSIADVRLENVTASGSLSVGGLFGAIDRGTITDSYVSGDVHGSSAAGGLGGSVFNDSALDNVSADGTVEAEDWNAGGLAAYVTGGDVRDSFASATVHAGDRGGGLLGLTTDNVTSSYATGDVIVDGTRAGGLVGATAISHHEEWGGDISNSYATGNVTGADRVGGLIGYSGANVTQSYATGNVSGDDDLGGLIGYILSAGTTENAYWDRGTTNQPEALGYDEGESDGLAGFGETADTDPADEMTGLNATENMASFEFPDGDGTWHVVEDDYPVLAWQETAPYFDVNITETNSPVVGGETLTVTTTVTNWAGDGTQPVTLTDTGFVDEQQDEAAVTLDSGEDEEIDLKWETDESDGGTGTLTVASDNDTATMTVSVHSASIAEPTTIEIPGAYEIVDDITHDETVIEIVADDVVLDGTGHTLTTDDPDGEAHGIHVDGTENVTVENVTVVDTDGWGVVLTDGASATVDRLDVGDSTAPNTTLSFDGTDVRVDAAADPPDPPEDRLGVDRYFTAENTSPTGELDDLELAYEDADLSENIDEASLALWKYDEGWQTVEESGVDTERGVVTATVTEFSTFGAFGDEMRFADGDGSAENPYEIETWEHLHNVSYELEANFTLVADLDTETAGYDEFVGGEDGFDPIGDVDDEFNGSFDGDGHTIERLAIDRPTESHVGLFGVVGSASTLEHVSLVDATVTGAGTVGGLVGEHNGGEVWNVSVAGTVSGEGSLVGGLVGFHNIGGALVDVSTAVDVDGEDWVGGVVGESWGEITTATATGDVSGDGKVGGLVGSSNDNITDAVATGTVDGTDDAVGGLVGQHWDGEISRSTATGDVYGGEDVAGLVGQNRATVTESAAAGDVEGGDLGTGGLVGWNNGAVSNSLATGVVGSEEFVGGLVGENDGTVTTSYATGVVDESESAVSAGGLVGESSGEVDHSYWDSETTGQNESAGSPEESGLTTAELTGLNATANMDGFVFPNSEGTWYVTDAYPALAWQDTDPFFEVTIEETNSPVEAGETLTVTASVTNWADDGLQTVSLTDTGFTADQQDTTDITLETGQSATVELDWTTDAGDAGTGEVTVASESHAATESVTVEATDEDEDEKEDESDSDPDSGPDPDPDEGEDTFRIETVHETHDEFQQLRVSIVNSPPYQRFDLRLADPSVILEPQHPFDLRVTREDETVEVGGAGATLTNVTLDVGDVQVESLAFRGIDGGALSLVANASSEPLAGTPNAEFPEPGMAGLAYLDVSTTFDTEDVTFTFRVEEDAVTELASAPEAVSLHQYNETTGVWDTRETTLVEEDAENETLVYETTADSFSAWAVGAERPLLELVETNLDVTTVTAGESVTVEATVENSGTLDGEANIDLRLDGEPIDSQQVEVAAGDSRQVVFAYTFDETGQYTLGVDDIVSEVTVEEDAPEDSATDDAPEDSATDDAPEEDDELADADDDGAGLGVGVALLALAVFAAVILRTHLVVRLRPER